ncbi:MAG TPA: OmpA family protein [Burkholderiaceae bacterium]|jgi:outer membrane protein OmpA-like peptidoglycan-associated protein
MAINLLDLIQRALPSGTTTSLATTLGEPESAIQSGLSTLLPTLLGGLASRAATPAGAANVFSMLTAPNIDPGLIGKLGSMLSGGPSSSLTGLGGALLGDLFGNQAVNATGPALAGITGMKPGNAASLLAIAAPLVFSFLKKHIAAQNLNPTSTAALLAGQAEHLRGRLEPAMTTALGLGQPGALLAGLGSSLAASGAAVAASGAAAASGLSRFLPWLLGLLVILGVLWYLFGGAPKPSTVAPTALPAPVAMTDLKTPAKVYFETGKVDIGADGNALIAAVAALLDKNKTINVDLTGYTDKTGDSSANQELAKNRALAVKAGLVAHGVSAERIGTQPPVFVEVGAGGGDAQARRVEISAR